LFDLYWTPEAARTYNRLKTNPSQEERYKAVKKSIQYLAMNPRHNSLETHEYHSMKGPKGEKIWVAYAQQSTPSAYRVFWYYGPSKNEITIIAITPHP